ncbi:MAG: GTPase (G3E family) [Lachnospiraceae bacterium]|nr:GTPase (G3E family) [Lachnospiraceae bacterium]
MTKVDLVTGFLGSGKTTFIKKYVKYLTEKGEKVGVIENDFGAISVDLMLLDNDFPQEVPVEMIVAADMDCYRRRFKTKLISFGMQKLDRVIVEPSGIFDTDDYFDIIYDEPLERWYEKGSVITVVDSDMASDLSAESEYIFLTQIANAGSIVFSKINEKSNQESNQESNQDSVNNEVTTVDSVEKTKALMNSILEKYNCKRRINDDIIIQKSWDNLTKEDYEKIASSGYISESFVKKNIYEHNFYKTLFFYNVSLEEKDILNLIKGFFNEKELGKIYRIKGFLPKENSFTQINATRENIEISETNNGQEVLVIIGEDLNEEKIVELIKKYSLREDIICGSTEHRNECQA